MTDRIPASEWFQAKEPRPCRDGWAWNVGTRTKRRVVWGGWRSWDRVDGCHLCKLMDISWCNPVDLSWLMITDHVTTWCHVIKVDVTSWLMIADHRETIMTYDYQSTRLSLTDRTCSWLSSLMIAKLVCDINCWTSGGDIYEVVNQHSQLALFVICGDNNLRCTSRILHLLLICEVFHTRSQKLWENWSRWFDWKEFFKGNHWFFKVNCWSYKCLHPSPAEHPKVEFLV